MKNHSINPCNKPFSNKVQQTANKARFDTEKPNQYTQKNTQPQIQK